jgi:S-adenosylmethionine-diacylglycerol 3-amino-3-carboxypropyl transferase
MPEHADFMSTKFARLRWEFLVFLLGNSSFFNAVLYGGHFPQKNTPGSHRSFYKSAYDRIFAAGLPRDNFFLQLTLLGEIKYPEGNPVECRPDVFAKIKSGIRSSKIDYVNANVVDFISSQSDAHADFISLSDVPSYFDNDTAVDFLQRMRSGLSSGALVVARYYLRVLSGMNFDGYQIDSQNSRHWIELEKTQMYDVGIYKTK